MSIVRAFTSGLRRGTTEPSMIVILYIVNIVTALPLALAFRAVLMSGFGSSMAPAAMMGSLDLTATQDFLTAHRDELSAVFRQISWVVIISMIINTFLAGGILTILKDSRGQFTASAFFGGCGAYISRFLRLLVLFVVVLLLVVLVMMLVVSVLTDALTANASSEITEFWVRIAMGIVFMLPVMIVLMIADYARVSVVLNDEHSMLKSAWKATAFVGRHFLRTFGLQLLMLLVAVLLFAVYMSIDLSVGMTSGATIVLMVVVQQLYIASKAWTRIMFFEGQLTLYESIQPIAYTNVEPAGPTVTEPAR